MWSRWPMTSAVIASTPVRGLSRRSRMTTSSWQSMPSTRKTASACSSHVAHVTLGAAPGLSTVEGITRGLAAGLLDVPQPLAEQREHVLVVERVENHPALAPRPDDAGVAQQAELMRHGRLGDAELTGEIADTELRPRQGIENPHPRRIAEHAKDLGQAVNGMHVKS